MKPLATALRRGLLSGSLLFLVLLGYAGLLPAWGQQNPTQQPSIPGTTSPDASPHLFDQPKESRSIYFSELERDLNAALTQQGLDPEHQTFHFVILLNCSTPGSAGYERLKDAAFGLLRFYLIESSEASDHVTFVPYQLSVREDQASWNQIYSRQTAQTLYKLAPDKAEILPGFEGGRDFGKAILEARDRSASAGILEQTVFIALTDGKWLGPPIKPIDYNLVDPDPQLKAQNGVIRRVDKPRSWPMKDENGKSVQYTTQYRIYFADRLKPLGILSHVTRSQQIALPWGEQKSAPETAVNAVSPKSDPDINQRGGFDPTILIVSVLGCIAVLAGLIYAYWLRQPRSLALGVNDMQLVPLTFGTPVFLGAAAGRNTIALDDLPDGIGPTEKLARLDVTFLGAVRVSSQRWNVERSPVVVNSTSPKQIKLFRKQAAGLMDAGEMVVLTIKMNR